MNEVKQTREDVIALKRSTGVDFSDDADIVDPKQCKIIRDNHNDPIIIAKFLCADNKNLVRCGKELYKYNGVYYDFLTDEDLDKMLMDFCLKYSVTKAWKGISQILRALNVYPRITSVEKMNPYENLICLKNGVLNIYTKELTPHDPKYFFDYALEISYDENAKECPNFVGFLNDVLSGEKDSIANIIRLGGYLLDTSCRAKKCFFFDGPGGSGKSTLVDTFTMFFPEREIHPVVSSLSLEELSGAGFDKADLIYSRCNICAETKKGYYDAEFLKLMVTGDLIKVSRKYVDAYTMRYKGKIILLGNGLPKFNDTSDGIYRRIIIVKFLNQYKPIEEIGRLKFAEKRRIFPVDVELFDKIKKEASAILNLFIAGLIDLRNNKYQFIDSESSIKAMKEFQRDSDTVREFLEDNYQIDFTCFIPVEDVFAKFRLWYMDNVQDTRAMKFRSAELSKRIKEVFGLDAIRKRTVDVRTGESKYLSMVNLREFSMSSKMKEDEMTELMEETARDDKDEPEQLGLTV